MESVKLTEKEFATFAKIVRERTGIHLEARKLSMLSNRLRRRLRALKLSTFAEYLHVLRDRRVCEEELPHFLSVVTTNETYFFRNEKLWDYIRNDWIPYIVEHRKRAKAIRVWSAASSTGAEAYTVAICLHEAIPDFAAWRVQVIGSDISRRVLEAASEGEYDEYAIAKVPQLRRKRWFDAEGEKYRVKDELRKMVSFKFHDLREPFPNANFDLVFLRNVLMYFDLSMKLHVLQRVASALAPGGHLIVGDVDPIRHTPELNTNLTLDYVGPNIYRNPKAGRAKGIASLAEAVKA